MKRVRCTEQQVEINQELMPAPNPITDSEDGYHYDRIEREKIRRQGDKKVVFGDDDVPSTAGDFHFFDASAKQPGPECMREFMPEVESLGMEQPSETW